ncbi:MAG: biotin transporter BioY [Oscillospiraceae bacterium]|nr:biotin transporter BioY [Oscillospiraceae bacterium]
MLYYRKPKIKTSLRKRETHEKTIPVQKLVLCALFAALTAVGAFIRVPTAWVSFTLQVLFVFLAGALLGPKYGAISQAVYVALGLVGIPIFTNGGGFTYVFQPSFGFLLSYIPAAALVGAVVGRREAPGFWRIVCACLAGLAVIYAIGVPYMGLIINVYMGSEMGLKALLWSGMIMFLPFDGLKIVVTGLLAKPLIPRLHKLETSRGRR